MATYYVRNDGNDANSGLGPAVNQAWQTLTYALSNMVLTNGINYLYIAPGVYRESPTLTVTPTATSTLVISGNPTASEFSGLTAGVVRLTNFTSDTSNPSSSNLMVISGKNYITIENIFFECFSNSANFMIRNATNTDYLTIRKCIFSAQDATGNANSSADGIYISTSTTVNQITITQCTFSRCRTSLWFNSTASASTSQIYSISNSLFINCDYGPYYSGNGLQRTVYNSTFIGGRFGVNVQNSQSGAVGIYNCLFLGGSGAAVSTDGSSGITENYNRFISTIPRNNVAVPPNGANSVSVGVGGLDYGYGLLTGMANQQMFSTLLNSPNYNFGTTSGAPGIDMYGVTWTGANPDAGSATYRSLSNIGSYLPIERTNNSFTVSPNTTNRTELIYLGAKGITHTTPLLSASYVRAGAIRTAITLVSQTPNGSWTSGGFCEIDSTNMPGIYRIDVPNALFVAGAESAMLQLTGASQTNGAVVHYNMAKVQFDLSQNVPLTNTAHSIGDALNAARAQGFGKWQIVGNTMNIYAEDGITLVKSFNLDSGSYPTQRM
jgi:hypothetical protein